MFPDEWRKGTRNTLEALTSAGLRLAVMRDPPVPGFDVPGCLARSVRFSWFAGGACAISESAALNPAIFEAERAAARGLPNVHFLDLTDQFCQRGMCWTVQNGTIMYHDSDHLTGNFADSLMAVLQAELVPIMNGPSDR